MCIVMDEGIESFEAPSLLLRLPVPEAEEEWQRKHVESLRTHDLFSTYFLTILMRTTFVLLRFAYPESRLAACAFISFELVCAITMIYLQTGRRRKFYAANRCYIVGGIRVWRAFMMAVALQSYTFPIIKIKEFSWKPESAWMLLSKTLFPILQTFGFRVELRHQLLLIPFTAAAFFYQSTGRCALVCNVNPAFYCLKYSSSREIFASLHSLMIFGPHVFQELPSESTCINDCELVRSFLFLFVGFLIPTLILAAFEETSRLEILSRYGGTPFYQSSIGNLFYSFLMLPFLAFLIFELVSSFYAIINVL